MDPNIGFISPETVWALGAALNFYWLRMEKEFDDVLSICY